MKKIPKALKIVLIIAAVIAVIIILLFTVFRKPFERAVEDWFSQFIVDEEYVEIIEVE